MANAKAECKLSIPYHGDEDLASKKLFYGRRAEVKYEAFAKVGDISLQ